MSTVEIWLLAVGLAMDCFTVSVTSGVIVRRVRWPVFLLMAFCFGLFQAVMPVAGWWTASRFSYLIESYDHWLAFGLLAFLGVKMIREGRDGADPARSHGHFDPASLKVVLALSVATSIDALAVGISFAFVGMDTAVSILGPVVVIGLVSFVLSMAGSLIGVFFGRHLGIRAEMWGGVILIGIGGKILLEHLVMDN